MIRRVPGILRFLCWFWTSWWDVRLFVDIVVKISFWRVEASFRLALINVVISGGGLVVPKEMNTTSVFELWKRSII